ncbi:MAG TPA: AAA family ATPase [Desulfuromonadales bacterium]|nr:AAA family ATPase [Desulfuromonadales bacterium]
MILRSLELKNFGKFGERAFEFRRGLNLVIGPNEAGKSTLMEAIPTVLFGVRNKDRFKPWGRQGCCEAALCLESRQGTLRIERDVLSDRVTLTERDDLYQVIYQFEGKVSPQGRSSERGEYLEQLNRLFGLADEDVFRASVYFGQGSLEFPTQGGLAGKIKTLLSGFVEVDYDKVLASLQNDYFSITRHSPWGKDKTRERELDEVRRRIDEMQARWLGARQGLAELEGLQREIASLQAGIETDRDEYAKGERYLSWVRKQWHLEEKGENLRKNFDRVSRQSGKIAELEARRQDIGQELGKTGLPRTLPADLPILLAEAEDVRSDLVNVQKESAALRDQLLKHPSPRRLMPAVVTGIVVAAILLLAWLRQTWLLPGGLGGAFAASVAWAIYLARAGTARAERGRFKGQAQVLEQRREAAQARLEGLDERFEALGLSPSAVAIVKMQKNLARHQELLASLADVESALRVLDDGSELTEERSHLTRELAVLDERLERERPVRSDNLLSPEELPEAEDKLQQLGVDIRERETKLAELLRRQAALEGELSMLQQIEEEGERLKEREEKLSLRKDALALAYDLLAGSVEEFRESYLDRFAAEVGYYLGTVTAGRYEQVRLDEDFALSLPEKGSQWRPAEHFSRGTVDAVYFAIRLALARMLFRGRHLPLLLDDPMVNFDHLRLGEALKSLERLSADHQLILFSHDDNLLRRATRDRWHVVPLEENRPAGQPAMATERSEDVGQLSLL